MKKCLLFNIGTFCATLLIVYDIGRVLSIHQNSINKLSEFHYKDFHKGLL